MQRKHCFLDQLFVSQLLVPDLPQSSAMLIWLKKSLDNGYFPVAPDNAPELE